MQRRQPLCFQHERFTRAATGSIKGWTWANGQTYDRFTDGDGRTVRYTVGDKLQNLVYDNTGRIQQSYRSLPATLSSCGLLLVNRARLLNNEANFLIR